MVELMTVRLAELVNATIERWNPGASLDFNYAVPVCEKGAAISGPKLASRLYGEPPI
jgi:hypothetical protein